MKKFLAFFIVGILLIGCVEEKGTPISTTGVKKVTADVVAQASGLTVEQENIKKRVELENMPGAIKHLYVISAMSGQVIIYSTVKGKVTSSGKRLSPIKITHNNWSGDRPIEVNIAGKNHHTLEVLQDDGSYGSSIPYLYWWDVQGRYHQHYVSGGQIIHIGDQPMPVKSITINLENVK